jgi:thioredoxin 1
MSSLTNVTGNSEFKTEVTDSTLPVLVDFWAPWCGPCQMMAPVLEALAVKFDGKLKIVKMDTDVAENQQLAIDYQIQSIPNLKVFKDGKVIKEFVGYRDESQFAQELSAIVG